MLVLILSDFQYSQKAILSFEKCLNRQNHSSSGSFNPVKKISPLRQISDPPQCGRIDTPHPLLLFGKPWKLTWD